MLQYANMVILVQILVWIVSFTYLTLSATAVEQQPQLVLVDNSPEEGELTKVLGALTNAIYTLINSTNLQWNRHHNTTMEKNKFLRTMPMTTVWTFVGAVFQWAAPLLWILLWPLWLAVRRWQRVQDLMYYYHDLLPQPFRLTDTEFNATASVTVAGTPGHPAQHVAAYDI